MLITGTNITADQRLTLWVMHMKFDQNWIIALRGDVEYNVQWSLTYPDTSVPRLIVRITEFPDKWVTFC